MSSVPYIIMFSVKHLLLILVPGSNKNPVLNVRKNPKLDNEWLVERMNRFLGRRRFCHCVLSKMQDARVTPTVALFRIWGFGIFMQALLGTSSSSLRDEANLWDWNYYIGLFAKFEVLITDVMTLRHTGSPLLCCCLTKRYMRVVIY